MNICRVLRLSGKVWISWQFSCVICEEKNRYLTGSRHHVSGNSVLEVHGNVEHTPRERKRTPEPCSQPHDHWTTNTEDIFSIMQESGNSTGQCLFTGKVRQEHVDYFIYNFFSHFHVYVWETHAFVYAHMFVGVYVCGGLKLMLRNFLGHCFRVFFCSRVSHSNPELEAVDSLSSPLT